MAAAPTKLIEKAREAAKKKNYDYAVETAIKAGGDDQIVVPPSTVNIRTPTVVVDKNAHSRNRRLVHLG